MRLIEPILEWAVIVAAVAFIAGVGVLGGILWERYRAAPPLTDEQRAAHAILGALVCQGYPATVNEGKGASCDR